LNLFGLEEAELCIIEGFLAYLNIALIFGHLANMGRLDRHGNRLQIGCRLFEARLVQGGVLWVCGEILSDRIERRQLRLEDLALRLEQRRVLLILLR